MSQILREKHPEILSSHQAGRIVAAVPGKGVNRDQFKCAASAPPRPVPAPDLDVHGDVLCVAGNVEPGAGELQLGAVSRILEKFHLSQR